MPSRHSTAKTNKLWFLLILVILLAAAVVRIIAYILYLKLLSKATVMLQK